MWASPGAGHAQPEAAGVDEVGRQRPEGCGHLLQQRTPVARDKNPPAALQLKQHDAERPHVDHPEHGPERARVQRSRDGEHCARRFGGCPSALALLGFAFGKSVPVAVAER